MMSFVFVPAERRWNFREMLLLADPEEQAVARYLNQGDMYVLMEGGRAVCEAVVMVRGDECELMNLATCEDRQNRGYAGRMVRFLMERYKNACDTMLVGTSEDGRGFYLRLGFRDAFSRERFFIENYQEEIIENGRRCIDMYCLRINIGGNEK